MIANKTAMIAECPIASSFPNSKHALMNMDGRRATPDQRSHQKSAAEDGSVRRK
jgi:hypothetical protein